MRVNVRVKPRSSANSVDRLEDGSLVVSVTAPPAEGKANQAVVELLADFFKKPKRSVAIRSGFKSKLKVVEILE